MSSEDAKYYRDRANRGRRALLREKEKNGYYGDGAGKRYRVASDYMLAGQNEKALEFLEWFETEFPDDSGEPVFNLSQAICRYRCADVQLARYWLQFAMLSNLYMLPYLFGEPISKVVMWHSSNQDDPNYFLYEEDFLDSLNEVERQWIRELYYSDRFTRLREKHIETYRELLDLRDVDRRIRILKTYREFIGKQGCSHPNDFSA